MLGTAHLLLEKELLIHRCFEMHQEAPAKDLLLSFFSATEFCGEISSL